MFWKLNKCSISENFFLSAYYYLVIITKRHPWRRKFCNREKVWLTCPRAHRKWKDCGHTQPSWQLSLDIHNITIEHQHTSSPAYHQHTGRIQFMHIISDHTLDATSSAYHQHTGRNQSCISSTHWTQPVLHAITHWTQPVLHIINTLDTTSPTYHQHTGHN